MQESIIIHNFIHADFHCKNWQAKRLDDNNYQIVIYDCALVSSADNIEASHIIWEVFESCDLDDFEEKSNKLLYVLKTYLIKEGDIDSEFEEEIKTLYKNYLQNNLDFSFLANEIMEITLRRKFVANKSLCNIFLAISMILEFLCEANLANCDSTHVNSKALVIKRNLFELLNFCQVTNSYHLLQDSFKERLDKLKNKDNTFDNLFADLQRNELKFGSIDDIDDSDDNNDSNDIDVDDASGESGTNDASDKIFSDADDNKTINKIRSKSI